MNKIKLNSVSGSIVEKKLISGFKVENETYLIFDNESIGSMGLPIILVSKILDNKVVKIIDQEEWQKVKEYLKNVIAGNKMNYINLPSELMAEDIFYTQLTLPIPSFEALKNNYLPEVVANDALDTPNNSAEAIEAINPDAGVIQPEASISNSSEIPQVNIPEPVVTPVVDNVPVMEPNNPIIPEIPVMPETGIPNVDQNIAPQIETPVANTQIPEPVLPNMPTQEPEVAPNINMENPGSSDIDTQPIINPVSSNPILKDEKYDEIKDAFMKACENMFEALIIKFENKN